MIKLTKEDLEDIYSWGDLYCMDSELSEIVQRPLLNKIQYMIKNYPEEGYLSYDEFPRYSIKHVLLKSDSGDNQT